MHKLDQKEIVRNAIDGLTYSKAYDLFATKKVKMSCRINELNQDIYDGIVTGKSNKSYPVSAVVAEGGKIVKASCKCDYYLTYPGYCKHILAMLLQIYETTNKKGSDVLTPLLQYYKKNVTLNINLVPIFHSYKYDTGIELKIGRNDKYYFVKNIPELYDNINNNFYFKYGKELEFTHSLSAFDQDSRNILETLSDYLSFYTPNTRSYFDGKRKCKIPKIIFKTILDYYLNKRIEFVFDDVYFDLIYTNEMPDIQVSFENDTLLLKNRKNIKLISVGRNHFLIQDGKLYCIDNTIPNQLIPLINTLYIQPIVFNDKIYNEFFAYIYPNINGLIAIENEAELVSHNNNTSLETKCYLDISDGILKLTYEYYYEGKIREEAINDGIYPNIAMEENFTEQLQYFNFIKTPNHNEYVLDNMDEAIDFILNGVEDLNEIATVFISDTIKNLKPIKTSGSPIGIRYTNNWLELIFEDKFFNISELKEILKSIKQNKKYHLLKDGTILNIQEKFFNDLEKIADTNNLNDRDLSSNTINVPLYKLLQFDRVLDSKAIPSNVIKFLYDLKNYNNINYPLDPTIGKVLRNYQKEGNRWLYNLANYHLSGILADDMGLGKTLEIIALLKTYKSELPTLIVTPASLTYNWSNEFKKWAKDLNVTVVSGNQNARDKLLAEVTNDKILITSYDFLKRDIEIYKKLKFQFIIIDEAQAIKNYQTKNAEAVKSINAISRFALTGTPIENSLADLWSIFDFCLPGYLKSYERFKEEYEVNIIKNNDSSVLEALNHQVAPFILRRTKADVLKELPEKFEQVIYAPMSEEQEKVYKATLLQAREKIIQANGENKMYIFSMLTRLRQICCHPKLYISNYEGDSAKLDLVNNIIYDSINSNHRILIFSQFTSMLDLLHESLRDKGISHYKLTGSTPSEERFKMVDEFNNNPNIKVFLISLKAGGTGLNLVGADTVIHYDPWWNFSAENQASDRVYRIGQKNNVQIIKMITKDSIEEKILDLQNKKKDLFTKVVSEDTNVLTSLSNEELLSLFNIDLKK